MYWFSADIHFGHKNIIKFCNRPFESVEEMDETIISNFNSLVQEDDIVVHIGDFTLIKNYQRVYHNYVKRLNGDWLFIKGSHDYWLPEKNYQYIWQKMIEGHYIVACHYAMRVWGRSHYNSWQLYGHSHGGLPGIGKQMDVGVDTNNYFPYSFEEIRDIMDKKEDNFNLVNKKNKKELTTGL